ncbi:MAG TPA: hypothetical protein VKB70_07015, partial [Gaiellaceae bacterium]|nr:hypothetical protein [Gaiellaceae bacterium]
MRDDERALLDHMLSIDFLGVDELRAQAKIAKVRGGELPWNIYLFVPDDAPAATSVDRNPVVRAVSRDPAAVDAVDVTLWLDGNYLASIDVSWFDEGPPTCIPRPADLSAPTLF